MPIAGRGYPVTLVLAGRSCLVVGGGPFALPRVDGLLATGALVTLVGEPPPGAAGRPGLEVLARPYRAGEAAEYHLVVAASGDADLDARVAADAEAAGRSVNVVDDPARSNFILPAIHRAGALSFAISSDGRSPALSRWLRDELVAALSDRGLLDRLPVIADAIGDARSALHDAGATSVGRDWGGLIAELCRAEDPHEFAARRVSAQLSGEEPASGASTPE